MKTEQQVTRPTQQEIAAHAYRLWELEGRQHGRDFDYWLQAEAQLIAGRKQDAAIAEAAKKPEPQPAPVPAPTPAPVTKAPATSAPAPAAVKAEPAKPAPAPQKTKTVAKPKKKSSKK